MGNERKRIGVDLDDTSLEFINSFIEFSNKTYNTNLRRENFVSYSFQEVLKKVGIKNSMKTVFEFYDSDFFRKMPPLPGSVEAINLLKQNYDLYVITYRPDYLYNDTINQIWTYFRGCFSDVLFAFNPYTDGKHTRKTKVEICLDNGISKMIDDSLDCILECEERGISGLLFGDNPWNQNGEHRGITRAENWRGVLKKLGVEK